MLLDRGNTTIPFLVEGLVPQVGITEFVGVAGLRKSLLMQQLGLDITSGDSWLGFKLNPKRRRVIYVSTEDDDVVIEVRARKQLGALNYDVVESLEGFITLTNYDNLIKELKQVLSYFPVDVIIVDSKEDAFEGDINTTKIRNFMNAFYQLSKPYKLAIVFVHHLNKGNERKKVTIDMISGSHSIGGKTRSIIGMHEIPNGNRLLYLVKVNYVPDGMKDKEWELEFDPQSLTFTNLGVDTVPMSNKSKPKNAGKEPHEVDPDIRKKILHEVYFVNGVVSTEIELRPRKLKDKLLDAGKKHGVVISVTTVQSWIDRYKEGGRIIQEGVANSIKKYRFSPSPKEIDISEVTEDSLKL
jgi:hypothetical protein